MLWFFSSNFQTSAPLFSVFHRVSLFSHFYLPFLFIFFSFLVFLFHCFRLFSSFSPFSFSFNFLFLFHFPLHFPYCSRLFSFFSSLLAFLFDSSFSRILSYARFSLLFRISTFLFFIAFSFLCHNLSSFLPSLLVDSYSVSIFLLAALPRFSYSLHPLLYIFISRSHYTISIYFSSLLVSIRCPLHSSFPEHPRLSCPSLFLPSFCRIYSPQFHL